MLQEQSQFWNRVVKFPWRPRTYFPRWPRAWIGWDRSSLNEPIISTIVDFLLRASAAKGGKYRRTELASNLGMKGGWGGVGWGEALEKQQKDWRKIEFRKNHKLKVYICIPPFPLTNDCSLRKERKDNCVRGIRNKRKTPLKLLYSVFGKIVPSTGEEMFSHFLINRFGLNKYYFTSHKTPCCTKLRIR